MCRAIWFQNGGFYTSRKLILSGHLTISKLVVTHSYKPTSQTRGLYVPNMLIYPIYKQYHATTVGISDLGHL